MYKLLKKLVTSENIRQRSEKRSQKIKLITWQFKSRNPGQTVLSAYKNNIGR